MAFLISRGVIRLVLRALMAAIEPFNARGNPMVEVPSAHEQQNVWITFFQNIQKPDFFRAFDWACSHLFPNGLCIHTWDGFFPGCIDGKEDALVQFGEGCGKVSQEVLGSAVEVRLKHPRDLAVGGRPALPHQWFRPLRSGDAHSRR